MGQPPAEPTTWVFDPEKGQGKVRKAEDNFVSKVCVGGGDKKTKQNPKPRPRARPRVKTLQTDKTSPNLRNQDKYEMEY